MNIIEKIDLSQKLLRAIFLQRRVLIATTLLLTRRCNLRCVYCGTHEEKTEEMSAEKVANLIDRLAALGNKFIKLSGGEPLLREDIGAIVNACKRNKMYVSINSNGILVKEKFSEIKCADEIQMTLDGTREINDSLRGENTYNRVIGTFYSIDNCLLIRIIRNVIC